MTLNFDDNDNHDREDDTCRRPFLFSFYKLSHLSQIRTTGPMYSRICAHIATLLVTLPKHDFTIKICHSTRTTHTTCDPSLVCACWDLRTLTFAHGPHGEARHCIKINDQEFARFQQSLASSPTRLDRVLDSAPKSLDQYDHF